MQALTGVVVVVGLWAAVFIIGALLGRSWISFTFAQRAILSLCILGTFGALCAAWWHVYRTRDRPNAVSVAQFGAAICLLFGGLAGFFAWAILQPTAEREMALPLGIGLGGILSCIVPAMIETARVIRGR